MNIGSSISIWSNNYTPVVGGSSFSNDYSMNFDGVDEEFRTSSAVSTFDGSKKISLSIWVKPTSGGASLRNVICNYRGGGTSAVQWKLFIYAGNRVDFSIDIASYYVRGLISAINYNQWNHILVCMDSSNTGAPGKMYINGVDRTSSTNIPSNRTLFSATTRLEIADCKTQYTALTGKIDEVALWNADVRALASDIYNSGTTHDLSALSTAPDHYWRMGDNGTWDGSNWTCPDQIGGSDITSVNMEEGDRVEDVPT